MRAVWLVVLAAFGLAHGSTAVRAPVWAQDARVHMGYLTCSFSTQEAAAPASDSATAPQMRDMLCTFKPLKMGAEETYAGGFQSVGKDDELPGRRAMIWIVTGPNGLEMSAGVLQQNYAAEAALTAGATPLLVGESNKLIVLQAMSDAQGQAAPDKTMQVPGAMIVLVSLTLRSTPA
jgi:hypothetical protein